MNRLLPVAVAAVLGAFAATVGGMPGLLMNSDGLLPAALAHELLFHPGIAATFQLPRVPSLVPDLLAYLPLAAVLPDWRLVAPCYAALSFAGLVWLGGLTVEKLGGSARGATATVLGLATAALAAALLRDPQGAFPMILAPVLHSGPTVLLAWAGLLLAQLVVAGTGPGWAVVAVGALGTLSDRLFLAAFLLPVGAGVLAANRAPPQPGWPGAALRRVAALGALGCAGGLVADAVLFHTVLSRQGIPLPGWAQLKLLPAMLRDPHLQATAVAVGLVGLLPMPWRQPTRSRLFWWAAALAGSVAGLLLVPLAYIDFASVRYTQPAWWWAVLVLAARLSARLGPTPALALGAAGVLAVAAGSPPRWDALARWHDPVADCLQAATDAGLVHAGLAGYWTARVAEASSEWRLHVAQVDGSGRLLTWGNNSFTTTHAPGGGMPSYDYLVLQGLDPARMAQRFGAPDARLECPGTAVWRWADPTHLFRVLQAAQPGR